MASKHKRAASSVALKKIPRRIYETELARVQAELVNMQEWVRTSGARVLVVFEGRDAAGKGARSNASRSSSIPGSRGSSPCPLRPSASGLNGISSATSRTCRLPGKSSSWTGPGTTGPGSNG